MINMIDEIIILFTIISTSFLYGVLVGNYELFPFTILSKCKNYIDIFANLIRPTDRKEVSYPNIEKVSKDPELSVHFIDVGDKQGDCFLINIDGGKTVLIDAGNESHGPGLCEYINKMGINEIDLLLLTHYHGDHYGGIQDIVGEFKIKTVLLPKYWLDSEEHHKEAVMNELKGIPSELIEINNNYEIGMNAQLEIIGPQKKYTGDFYTGNENSTVCRLNHDLLTVLFMGDATEISEMDILDSEVDIESNILKVGHHGYPDATCIQFIEEVNPSEAVITTQGKYSMARKKIIDRLNYFVDADCYLTNESGTIVVKAFENSSYDIITSDD